MLSYKINVTYNLLVKKETEKHFIHFFLGKPDVGCYTGEWPCLSE